MSDEQTRPNPNKGKQPQRIEPDLIDTQIDDDQLAEEDKLVTAINAEDLDTVHDRSSAFYGRTIRMALEIYGECSADEKKWANAAYPWLISRLKEAPEYGVSLHLVDNEEKPPSPFIKRIDDTRFSTLHPIFTDAHEVDGKFMSGMQILLAIGGYLNKGIRAEIDRAMIKDTPIPVTSFSTVSLGNARKNHSSGVYALRWTRIDKCIIGYTISQGFMYRLGLTVYSDAKKVVNAVGEGVDQTLNRENYVLFDLSQFNTRFSDLRWLATGLETLSILAFGTTSPVLGLNSRISDPAAVKVGYTFTQLLAVWRGVREVTGEGRPIPQMKGRRNLPGGMEEWVRRELFGRYFPSDAGVFPVCRIIRHLSILADTNEYPSFRPLAADAWLMKRPIPTVGAVDRSANSKIAFYKGMRAHTSGIKLSEKFPAASRQVDLTSLASSIIARATGEDSIFGKGVIRAGESRTKVNRERKLDRMRRMTREGRVEVDELDSTSGSEED